MSAVRTDASARFARPPQQAPQAATVLARLDRIDLWSLPYLFIGIIGLGFLFTFYDIFDINVSFIQTCVALKPGCTPENALGALKLPVVLNLVGCVIGTLALSPLADRYGRVLGYVTVYAFSAGFTSILTAVGYKPPKAGVIVDVGAFGFLACGLFAVFFGERLPRKLWLPIGAVLTLLGGVLVAAAGDIHRRGLHRRRDRVLRLQHLGADDLRALGGDTSPHARARRALPWSTASATSAAGSASCSSPRSSRT